MAVRDERMGAFDAVMFGIEGDPLLRSGIVAVIVLESPPDRDRVVERTERLTRLFPRLRQRAVGNPLSPAPPRWETDPNFDPDYHIRWRRLPDGDDDLTGALAFAARMGEQDFDKSRPLWEIAILTGLDDGRAAVIFKIHHSVADGMGGLALSAALFDVAPDPGDLGALPPAPEPAPAGLTDRFRQAAAFEIDALAEVVTGAARSSATGAAALVRDPFGSTRTAWHTASSAAAMLAPQSEPLSPLMSGRSLACVFTVIDVPLAPLKAAADAAGVTLNVVFIAAVADAVGAYHRAHGTELPGFRVNMPISQRRPGDEAIGNHWVPARFVVPCGQTGAAERLRRLHGVVDDARTDPALGLSEIIYKALALLPAPVTERLAGMLMKGVDVAATNVPGPPVPIYLCGSRVTMMVPFAPKSGAAVNVALFTYDGTALLGVNTDPAAVPDPGEFTRYLAEAVSRYSSLAG
ncbi:wax ester/triacylglycerol synthase domain-containing protein [Gordonia sp. FQ]|uniref:wax ester/triacylglycerol synthase domain-containing protein n=1 Tax=Gordonia sp. FQ TaxID=3446634 RepID=UPI003F873F97